MNISVVIFVVCFGAVIYAQDVVRALPKVKPVAIVPDSDAQKRIAQTPWSKCSMTCGTRGIMYRMYAGKRQITPCGRIPCQVVNKNCKIDLTLVLDRSGSTYSFWGVIKQFAKDIVSSLPIGSNKVRVGLITYSSSATINFDLDDFSTVSAIHTAIDAVSNTGGGTDTAEALHLMNAVMYTPVRGDRWGVPNVAIVVTDGRSNNLAQTTLRANQAKGEPKNIVLYAVGVGSAHLPELNAISSGPGYVHNVGGASNLQTIVSHLSKNTCEQTQKYKCCSVCGDPHYKTFDDKWIHFQGKCKYNVASRRGIFSVHGKNTSPSPSSSVSYLSYFDVTYGGTTVRLGPGSATSIRPAGTPVTPPQTVAGIHVTKLGSTLTATLTNNVRVTYNGNHCGKVCVPEKYAKQMHGICGNYDYNTPNDLRTSFYMSVPDTHIGHHILGMSHQVTDPEDKNCCSKLITRVPCEKRDHQICEQIKERFARCAKVTDLNAAYKACTQDACAAGRDETQQRRAACNIVSQLVDTCKEGGVTVWNYCYFIIKPPVIGVPVKPLRIQ